MKREAPITASSVRGALAFFALACLAFAYGCLAQGTGSNQGSHYALVKALAQRTPRIDTTRQEIGDLATGDLVVRDGHVYSDKAPGLAFLALPSYLAFRAVGGRTHGDPAEALWVLTLWAVVVPALVLAALVALVAERLEPGLGLAVAVFTALGTLLLPYGTLFYAHALSAALGFAAFTLLFFARQHSVRLGLPLAAGVAAGMAVTTEYPLALLAVLLAGYLLADGDRVRRLAAYAGGLALGVTPLLAYNNWAFGRPWHVSYAHAALGPGNGLLGLGVSAPHPVVALQLLLAPIGLFRMEPVLVAGLVGLVLLYRRGSRAEALLAAVVFFVYLTYNSGYFAPFGGISGGPRYLIVTLPFLALGLPAALRAAPGVTVALGVASLAMMACVTATHPLAAADGHMLHRLFHGGFSQTFVDLRFVLGWPGIIPFFAAVCGALGAAVFSLRGLLRERFDAASTLAATAAWCVLSIYVTRLVARGSTTGLDAALAFAAASALAVGALLAAARSRGVPRKTPAVAAIDQSGHHIAK